MELESSLFVFVFLLSFSLMKRLLRWASILCILAYTLAFFDALPAKTDANCGWYSPFGNAANTHSISSGCSPSTHKIKKLWEYIDSKPLTGMIEGNGKVYGTTIDSLFCLASSNGKMLWKTQLTNPKITGLWSDKICINSQDGMMGLDASNGKRKWQKTGFLHSVYDGQIFYSPVDLPGVLISGSTTDGSEIWQYRPSKPESQCKVERLAMEGNKCILLSRDWTDKGTDSKTNEYFSNIHCLDVLTGRLYWKKSIGSENFGHMSIRDGKILIHLKEIGLNAIDAVTGQILWFSPSALDYGESRITADNQKTLILQNSMLCLNISNGKKLWSQDYNCSVTTQPVLDSERLWTGILDVGTVVCLDSRNGLEKWRWGLPQSINRHVIAGDGKVYAMTNEGKSLVSLGNANEKIVFRINDDDYTIDNKPMVTKAVPFVKDGLPYASMSIVIGNLGGYYSYDYTTQNLIVQLNKTTAHMRIGKNNITVNGQKRQIDANPDVTPMIKNGYVMIPVKLFDEVFKLKTYSNLKNKMLALSNANF